MLEAEAFDTVVSLGLGWYAAPIKLPIPAGSLTTEPHRKVQGKHLALLVSEDATWPLSFPDVPVASWPMANHAPFHTSSHPYHHCQLSAKRYKNNSRMNFISYIFHHSSSEKSGGNGGSTITKERLKWDRMKDNDEGWWHGQVRPKEIQHQLHKAPSCTQCWGIETWSSDHTGTTSEEGLLCLLQL